MKKIILCIMFSFMFMQQTIGQLPANQKKNNLNISFNKNIEFLGFAYFIAFEGTNSETKVLEIEGKEVLEKDWQNYGFQFYQHYKYLNSSTNLQAALKITEHLWLSDIIPLLLQTGDFPRAGLHSEIEEKFYQSFSADKNLAKAREQAILFLNACNDFYREANFDQYLQNSTVYYQAAVTQIIENLSATDFISATEKFYRKSFDHYTLIPSLTIPKGMGFGPHFMVSGRSYAFSVFGAVDYQYFLNTKTMDMGFGHKNKLRELSVHEFGHAFVNPEINKILNEVLRSSAPLFEPLRTSMEKQGYNTWKTCITEHFVRAGEVMITKTIDSLSAEKLKEEYVNARKFIYLPLILEELRVYNKGSEAYTSMVNRVLQRLNKLVVTNNPTIRQETGITANPREAKFHTEDIVQFWKLMDQYNTKITGEILQTEYIDKGSAGVKGFVKNRIESGKNLSKVVKGEMEYYQYVRPFTQSIDEKKELFYTCFEKLKQLYPEAVFPDIYFVIGANNTGGTTFEKGLIIGAERFGKPNNVHKPALDIENVHRVITHESIHFQQHYVQNNSLLAQTIREGAADFICELVTGDHSSNKEMYAYGERHKKELTEEFISKMNLNDWNGWLYYQKDKSRPKDLGYWMGYKICKAYYENSTDKQKAIRDMLTIQDFKEFFQKSKFNGE